MRFFVLVGVLAISACGVPGARKCKTNGDCEKQLCLEGYCYYPDDGGTGGGSAGGAGGGATGGGDGVGGSGGGVAELTSLSITSPKDGARTKNTTVALTVEGKPLNATGKMVTYAASLVDGGNPKGASLTADAGNVYEATLSGLTEGEWKIEASSGTLKSSVKFVVDKTAPSVKLAMEPAPTRMNDGGLNEIDPASGYAQAFRRDEVGELRVLTSEAVQFATSQFTGVPAGAITEKTPCSGACDAGACRCFNVDMTQVTIPSPGFRGELTVGLKNVSDDVGNVAAEATTTFKVTRWKWKKLVATAPAALFTPAIDTSGRLFVGATIAPTTGIVMGLNANGSENFNASYGAMTAPAVVGRNVYVATKDGTDGKIRMIDAVNGSHTKFACAASDRTYSSPMAVVGLTESDDRVLVASDKKTLSAARPTAGSNGCLEATITDSNGYTVIGTDSVAYVGLASKAIIERVPWASSNWGTPENNISHSRQASGLALFGTTLGGAGGGGLMAGGVYAYDAASFVGGMAASATQNGGDTEATGPVIINSNNESIFIYGNGVKLIRIAYSVGNPGSFSVGSISITPTGENITTTPLVGSGTIVHIVDSLGTISAYSADLSQLKWRLAAGAEGMGAKVGALNIDVSRKTNGDKECGKPGTLYASSTGDGSLYAFVVDSKGIDATAPWPRFQHDPRNSGNPAVPLSDFSCP